MKKLSFVILVLLLFSSINHSKEGKIVKKEENISPLIEKFVSVDHSALIDGNTVRYRSTAGTLLLKNEKGVAEASLFFIAYTKKATGKIKNRPVTFSFNGGPGSSSVWLHLGLLGPKRVLMNSDGSLPSPPFKLIPNNYSLLDKTDLVFIDPVGTGFSRAAKKELNKKFHGVSEDVASVGEFIRLYLKKFNRWASPKFLIGESYGTTRAAGLSGYLQNELGINLNGIMLISSILNFETTDFDRGNDLPYILFLPTFTSTAYYHGKIDKNKFPDFDKIVKESERYAMNEYTLALMKGDLLDKTKRELVAKRVSELTGLSFELILENDLRIDPPLFYKKLLGKEGKSVGRLDGRLWSYKLLYGKKDRFSFFNDPSYAAIQGPFTETFNDYVRSELNFRTDIPYEILTHKLSKWNIGKYYGKYVNVSDILRNSIVRNPYLKVFVAGGYFDFATPFFAAKYTFNHFNLPEKLRKNISFGFYKAGHMMYINTNSLAKLSRDLKKFIDSSE